MEFFLYIFVALIIIIISYYALMPRQSGYTGVYYTTPGVNLVIPNNFHPTGVPISPNALEQCTMNYWTGALECMFVPLH